MIKELVYKNFTVKIRYKNIKNISLRVKMNGEVCCSSPYFLKKKELESFIEKNIKWIENKVGQFKKEKTLFINGEDFIYLGKRYPIKLYEHKTDMCRLNEGNFELFVKKEDDYFLKERLVDEWYKKRAKVLFEELIEKYNAIVQKKINRVTVKKMTTRWGSCNHCKGYINLNLELMKKPLEFIEYVVFHELSHLIYPNHSKNFYNYIESYMPDWKERKRLAR